MGSFLTETLPLHFLQQTIVPYLKHLQSLVRIFLRRGELCVGVSFLIQGRSKEEFPRSEEGKGSSWIMLAFTRVREREIL
jgi:hypothetical protein